MPELLLLLALLLRTIAAETETVATEPDTGDTYTSLDQVETVEGFMRTREFKVDTEHDTGLMSTSWPAGVSWGAAAFPSPALLSLEMAAFVLKDAKCNKVVDDLKKILLAESFSTLSFKF